MIKSVCFLSREAVEKHLKPKKNMAIISIKDPEDTSVKLPKGVPSLRLEFHDIYEEAIGVPVGVFPDVLAAPFAVMHKGFQMPDGYHAERILSFVRLKRASPNMIDIVVHCQAGISRSAAVARFIADQYCVPIDQANPDTSMANARLLRLLNKAINDEGFTLKPSINEFEWKEPERHKGVYRGVGIF